MPIGDFADFLYGLRDGVVIGASAVLLFYLYVLVARWWGR